MSNRERSAPGPRRPSVAGLLAAQLGYQLRVLVRSPLGSFATLVVPLMVLLAVNLLYKGTHLPSRGNIAYTQFFTPAMIAFAVINACYTNVISQTTLARDEGILKRLRSTPLPSWIYMTGRLGSASLVALISAVVVAAVGRYLYGFDVIWASVPAALVTLAAGMFCFCAIGLAMTVLIPRADSAFPVAWGTILPLCFISDVFLPIEGAPRWLREIASFFPVRGFADALETAFNPVQGSHALQAGHLELLAAWGIVAGTFAVVAFRWEPSSRHERQAGTPAKAVFAIERARTLFLERDGAPQASKQHIRHQAQGSVAGKQSPPRNIRDQSLGDPLAGAERIEGPAPSEDASIPLD
jgi:ABC-2 type transport system permease protein